MLNVLDLFAGIGGFSLGLERAGGFRTVAFCEVDPKARKVLQKHWPNVPIYDDVRKLTGETLNKDGISVDVITGGFPCQDLSYAGKGAGLAGERSGLWYEYLRLITEITPQWIIIENVSALRSRGLEVVLRGLAEVGYDAEWHCIPASALGAPHQRDRLWIIAYPVRVGTQVSAEGEHPTEQVLGGSRAPWGTASFTGGWSVEPRLGGMAYGLSGRVDRVNQLGNAVVPQMAELIGKAIISSS